MQHTQNTNKQRTNDLKEKTPQKNKKKTATVVTLPNVCN